MSSQVLRDLQNVERDGANLISGRKNPIMQVQRNPYLLGPAKCNSPIDKTYSMSSLPDLVDKLDGERWSLR